MVNPIETRILKLIDSFSYFPEKDKSEIKEEVVAHGEYGLAFGGICYVINDRSIRITKDQYEEIVILGTEMEMDEKTWVGLKKLIGS